MKERYKAIKVKQNLKKFLSRYQSTGKEEYSR
jgi:hypothetical protein